MKKNVIMIGLVLALGLVGLSQGFSVLATDYKVIEVAGGDIAGTREANVKVDIGYGDRVYWAFTNEYGQLVKVTAKEIVLQKSTEPLVDGRYYKDEAKVPGTEKKDYDEGHVIADSLGGVSNAYNITPQDSTLNRHGDQAYMEKVIRDAGGCKDFTAIIEYADTKTQIPSHYTFTYTLKGEKIKDSFPNKNPEEKTTTPKVQTTTVKVTAAQPTTQATSVAAPKVVVIKDEKNALKKVDKNNNGKVTIKEAKEAGFKMPITNLHWLYKYMDDKDKDGKVGE